MQNQPIVGLLRMSPLFAALDAALLEPLAAMAQVYEAADERADSMPEPANLLA